MSHETTHLPGDLSLDQLIVTQDSLRDRTRVESMTEFVKSGGYFTPGLVAQFHDGKERDAQIQISQFPKEKGSKEYYYFVHDGHHRTVSIYLGGRDKIKREEYDLKVWDSLAQYEEVNKSVGWVTPFSPLNEMRLANFMDFKLEALAIEKEEDLKAFIEANRHRYCKPRKIWTVAELAKCIKAGECIASS